ncbi:MAG TPA: hypothetical protein VJO52_12660 [Gemmatimonadaceae bacterium]|nr:hypothetical protein [Gemmatimonadaceae bacterium]
METAETADNCASLAAGASSQALVVFLFFFREFPEDLKKRIFREFREAARQSAGSLRVRE